MVSRAPRRCKKNYLAHVLIAELQAGEVTGIYTE